MSAKATVNKNQGFLEGEGVHRDYNKASVKTGGNPVFETKNTNEWNEYQKKVGITESGTKPCIICSTQVYFKDNPVGKNVVCAECKKELI